jgi:hypothetical protein
LEDLGAKDAPLLEGDGDSRLDRERGQAAVRRRLDAQLTGAPVVSDVIGDAALVRTSY